jgi:hypothetical protein
MVFDLLLSLVLSQLEPISLNYVGQKLYLNQEQFEKALPWVQQRDQSTIDMKKNRIRQTLERH